MSDFGGGSKNVVDRYAFAHVWMGAVPSKEAFWNYVDQDNLPDGQYSAFMADVGEAAPYDEEFIVFGGCMCSSQHPITELFDDTIIDRSEHQAMADRCAELGITNGNAFICYRDPDLTPAERDYCGLRYLGQFKVQRIPKIRQY